MCSRCISISDCLSATAWAVMRDRIISRLEVSSMQRAGVVFLAVLLGFLLTGAAGAQVVRLATPTPTPRPTPSPSPTPTPDARALPCPSVTIQAQGAQPLRDGQSISFMANIVGGDPKIQPNILWTTSAGTSKVGQYSRHIEVDSTGAGGAPEPGPKVDSM